MDPQEVLETAPDSPAVFAIFAEEGAPYLARTTMLRRRLRRLLGPNSRLFSLRDVARRVEYVLTASKLESSLTYYQWAKRHFPDDWQKRLRLRWPSWVKLILSNEFPRTQVTARLTGGAAQFYGPFRSRVAAEQFEAEMLDLFQVRRCQEDLAPSPEHPGCIYGEMNLCLRPCQQAVTADEYSSEARRLGAFLGSGGESLLEAVAAARERASEDLEFEEAQRQHKRYEKIQRVLKLRDELSTDISTLCGIAVLPSVTAGCVRLQPLSEGWWQTAIEFALDGAGHSGQSMDTRLRETLENPPVSRGTTTERNEHVALLAQWFYSTWCDGEWLPYPISYRRLVKAISSVLRSSAMPPGPPASP